MMNITDRINWSEYDKYVGKRRTIGNTEFREFLKAQGLNPPKKYCWYCGQKISGSGIYYCCEKCAYEFSALCSWTFTQIVVRQKAENKCQKCGAKTKYGHIHHIEYISEGGSVFNPKNLIYLCEKCHRNIHATHFNKFKGLDNLKYFFKRFYKRKQADANQRTLLKWLG